MQPAPRFALELLAVADALRHCHGQVAFLVHAGSAAVAGQAETVTIMGHAVPVADALEAIAQRIATED
jgi:hypothetical protein